MRKNMETKLLTGISQHLHEAYMLMKLYQDVQDAAATYSGSLNAVDVSMVSHALSKADDELNRRTR